VLSEGAARPPSESRPDEGGDGVPATGRLAQLRILVPRHRANGADETGGDAPTDSTTVTLESIVALAEEVEHRRLTCAAALAVLLHAESPPHVGDVAQASAEFWIATIVDDDGAPAELLIDKVIGHRRVLPASRLGMFQPSARPGDWVCFFIAGSGVVGWARLHERIDPLTAAVRRPHRFTSVFTLASVSFHAQPVGLDASSLPQRLATRSPLGVAGSFLSPISEQDFRALTGASLPLPVEQRRT
jgi:hypothetical protein